MDGAVLDHPNLPLSFDDLTHDPAHLFAHQIAPLLFPVNDGVARLLLAIRAERIGLPRPAPRGWLFSHDFSSGLCGHF